MIEKYLTKIINTIFPHQKDSIEDERSFWDKHWIEMAQYHKKHGEIFEINDGWDFYCNEALHEHYKSIVQNFRNLPCVECGCGGGYESGLMSKEGAAVTILDYSKKALGYARIVSKRLGVLGKIKFVCDDIFNFTTENKYSLVWNCGVIEHYPDIEIVQIIKKMMALAMKNGLVIITVPNLLSPQSIYWMLKEGKGSEKYLSHQKLKALMLRAGLVNVQIRNLHYWLPSFLPHTWAVKISKLNGLNSLRCLTWLFSGVGTVP